MNTTTDQMIATQTAEIARLKKQVASLKKAQKPKLPPVDRELVNRYKRFATLLKEEPYLWTIRWWVEDHEPTPETFDGHFGSLSDDRKHAVLIAYHADPSLSDCNRIPESEWDKYINYGKE